MTPEPSITRRIGVVPLVGLALVWAVAIARDWVTLARFAYEDLTHFRQGGEFVRTGISPYDPSFVLVGNHLPYIYPPIWALIFAPLSLVPAQVLEVIWTAASLVALWALVAISIRRLTGGEAGATPSRRASIVTVAAVLALALGPVSEVLYFGQIGLFVVLACVVDAVILAERSSKYRGLLVGVATAIKLTPALIVAHWVITRQWRAAVVSIATTLVCWGVSAILLPSMFISYFLGGVMSSIPDAIGPERVSNQSLFGLLTRLLHELPPSALYLPLAAMVALVGLALARLAHQRGDLLAAISIVGLTSVLVAPMSWQHHATWVIPAIGAVIGDGRLRARLFGGLTALVLLYSPTQGAQVAALVGFTEFWNLLYVLLIAALAWIAWRSVAARRSGYEMVPGKQN